MFSLVFFQLRSRKCSLSNMFPIKLQILPQPTNHTETQCNKKQASGSQVYCATKQVTIFRPGYIPNHSYARSVFGLAEHSRTVSTVSNTVAFFLLDFLLALLVWVMIWTATPTWANRAVYLSSGFIAPVCCYCGLCLLGSVLTWSLLLPPTTASDWFISRGRLPSPFVVDKCSATMYYFQFYQFNIESLLYFHCQIGGNFTKVVCQVSIKFRRQSSQYYPN